jgi:hypothetical protein
MPWGDCTGPWWAQGGAPRRGPWGWFRGLFGRGYGYGPWWAADNQNPPYPTDVDEKTYLKNEESWLKSRLEAIRQRLRDLGEE